MKRRDHRVEFKFDDTATDDDIAALKTLLETEFPKAPITRARRAPRRPSEQTRGAKEILEIASLALSLPASLMATWELADRLQVRQKAARLIQWAKARRAQGRTVPSVITEPDLKPISLDRISPARLMDILGLPPSDIERGRP